jgi:hypothetical protein
MQQETLDLIPANTPETLGVTPRFVLQHNAISRSIHNLKNSPKRPSMGFVFINGSQTRLSPDAPRHGLLWAS